ncbi:MAG: FecR family protein [Rhodospirillum sp.]|nr:FecR family protein [Rhodospirillum sp.]MCF8489260.1 FecR family protein [Rhodospirillum sp.]MCF8502708.1 FecR family protein [Rhodospirillum sp.]
MSLRRLTTSCLVSLGLFASFSVAWAADPVGDVSIVKRDASARADGTSRTLAKADPVNEGEILSTGKDSRLEIALEDGSVLTLGETASLILDDFTLNTDSTSGALSVFTGAFLLVGGDKPHDGMTIHTPVATIGIRGTTVWGGQIDGAFGVMVAAGSVSVTTDAGTVILDEPGEGTMVTSRTEAPSAPVSWSEDKKSRAYATVALD